MICEADSKTNGAIINVRIKNDPGLLWEIWDKCDTHSFWTNVNWPGWESTSSWVNFDGRDCLKFSVMSNQGLVKINRLFLNENWGPPITGLVMDIYYATNKTGVGVKLETVSNGTTVENIATPTNLVYQQWKTCIWNFSTSMNYTDIDRMQLIFDGLGDTHSPYTFYLDNIRLISNNIPVAWDKMDKPHRWTYADYSDVVKWDSAAGSVADLEPITHRNTSMSNATGSIYLPWDASLQGWDSAKVEASGLQEDWSSYKGGKISAQVYCTATNHIAVGFYDGSLSQDSAEKHVSNINTWETIEWDIPSVTNLTWNNLSSIYFVVRTGSGDPTGKVYIDHIKRGW